MSKNLNTKGLLKKSPEDRLWYFLKNCLPSEEDDIVLVMLTKIYPKVKNIDGYIPVPGIPVESFIIDTIYSKDKSELEKQEKLKPYRKYFDIIKDCYEPYTTECFILDEYETLTEEQKETVKKVNETKYASVSLVKTEGAVRVVVAFSGCKKIICKEAWMTALERR